MGIYLILPTLLVILVSFLVVRAGAVILMMTGMHEKRARFQALSAFSGTGFTTKEAESVVNHPQRRRIVTWLMILGNAGIVTVIVTATSSLVTSRGYYLPISIAALIVGTYLIYKLISRRGLARRWEGFIENRLVKSHILEEGTTEDLLHLIEGYGIVRIIVTQDSPFVGRSLQEANTPDNEFWVVGVERGREWISLPRSKEVINEGDKLVVYGNLNVLKSMFAKD
jgi:hypothetical protein